MFYVVVLSVFLFFSTREKNNCRVSLGIRVEKKERNDFDALCFCFILLVDL